MTIQKLCTQENNVKKKVVSTKQNMTVLDRGARQMQEQNHFEGHIFNQAARNFTDKASPNLSS